MAEAPSGFVYETLAPILDGEAAAERLQTSLEQSASTSGFGSVLQSVRVPAWKCSDAAASSESAGLPGGRVAEDEGPEDEAEIEYISLDAEAEADEEEVQEEQTMKPEALLNLTSEPLSQLMLDDQQAWPWVRAKNSFQSPLLQLHQEILDFCKFISPTDRERQERSLAVQRVTNCIKSLWPHCKVEVFGSFATGLYLPSSDVDVVIMDSGCLVTQNGLRALAKVLRKQGLAKKLVVIAKARVPIVKFVETHSGISFDISFDVENGPEAAKFIQQAVSSLPPLRPLCMVLKIFLQQRELNEVYTGGVGSYALLVMLMAHLQLHPSRQSYGPLEPNLGVLLVDFFDLYGRALNMKDVGVSCSDGGRFFSKLSKGFVDNKRPYLLAVEDPQAPQNDIGKNSYNIVKVRAAFMLAHRLLTSCDVSLVKLGILGRIIRYDEKLISRKHLSDGNGVTPTYFFNNLDVKDDAPAHRHRGNRRKRKKEDVEQLKDEEERSGRRKAKQNASDVAESGQRSSKRQRQRGRGGRHERKETKDEPQVATIQGSRRRTSPQVSQKRGEASDQTKATKWRKVEDTDPPSPKPTKRSNYTDHYDNEPLQKKRVIMATPSHKKFKYL